MKASDVKKKLSVMIESSLKDEGIVISSDDVLFVLKRFFSYAIQMLLNGYPITIRKGTFANTILRLCYDKVRKLEKSEKRIYIPSSKMISYMLYVDLTRGVVKTVKFYPGPELQAGMIQIAHSDLIYKYISK